MTYPQYMMNWAHSAASRKEKAVQVDLASIFMVGNATAVTRSITGGVGSAAVTSTAYGGVVANLDGVGVIADDGDFVELRFSLDAISSNNNNPWAFRYGLFDNNGSPAIADNGAATAEWTGTFPWGHVRDSSDGADSKNGLFYQGTGTTDVLGVPSIGNGYGTSPTGLTSEFWQIPGAVAGAVVNTFLPQDMYLRLEKTNGQIIGYFLNGAWSGVAEENRPAMSFTPDVLVITSLGFAHSANFTVSNIQVLANRIVEGTETSVPRLTEPYVISHWSHNDARSILTNIVSDIPDGLAVSFDRTVPLEIGEYVEAKFSFSGGGGNNVNRAVRWGFFRGTAVTENAVDAAVSARYWRLSVDTQSSVSACQLQQLLLYDATYTLISPNNMTDNTTPSPYVATTSGAGSAYLAFDGTSSTVALLAGEWLSIDLGSALKPLRGRALWSGTADERPLAFRIQHSTDGTTWVDSYEWSATSPPNANMGFGLDTTTIDWSGYAHVFATRTSMANVGGGLMRVSGDGQELMNYGDFSGDISLTTGYGAFTSSVPIHQDILSEVTVRLVRVDTDRLALFTETTHAAGTTSLISSGSVLDGTALWRVLQRESKEHTHEAIFLGETDFNINAFAIMGSKSFTAQYLRMRHGTYLYDPAIMLNFGNQVDRIVSSNSPAHAEGRLPLSFRNWHSVVTTDYNNEFMFATMSGVRIGMGRANGELHASPVIWSQQSSLSSDTSSTVASGVFEGNGITQTYVTYARDTGYKGRPVGAILSRIRPGTYDVYVVAHNNNSVNIPSAATFESSKLTVGVGVTSDTRASLPEYVPDDLNLTWVELSVIPETSAWVENNNYARVRVTVTSMDEWLYVVSHFSYAESQDRYAGLSAIQLVRVL